jgi:hypothetical protein
MEILSGVFLARISCNKNLIVATMDMWINNLPNKFLKTYKVSTNLIGFNLKKNPEITTSNPLKNCICISR